MIKLYELTNSDACQRRRAFSFPMETKETTQFKKSVAIKTAIKDLVDGVLDPKDLSARLSDVFAEIPYHNAKERESQMEEAIATIMRYFNSEDVKSLTKATTKEIDIGEGLVVQVTPDFLRITDDEIEVIYIKVSRPKISQRKAKSDLTMCTLYKYGKDCLMPGEEKRIKASVYYLRKKSDTSSYFSEDFFAGETANVVSLSGVKMEKTETDYLLKGFAPIVKKYAEGLPKEECTEKDCEFCFLNHVCHYTDSPLALKREAKLFDPKSVRLSKEQRQIIDFEKGQLRVNAGAGAGKTLVLTLRLVTLINKGYDPKEILCITFTNAGAEEIRNRVEGIFDQMGMKDKVKDLKITTFNAFGNEIIEKNYQMLGFTKVPKLLDDIEQARIITNLLNENPIQGLDYKNFTMNIGKKGALPEVKQIFDYVKRKQVSAYQHQEVARALNIENTDNHVEKVIELYDRYDELLREKNLIEYSDQESMIFEVLHDDPYYMESLKIRHVLVDEFQDTSATQIDILKELMDAPTYTSFMAIGDDSQAIYSFRDTSPEYILHLEKYIDRDVEDINLVENHRSTPEILDAANRINQMRRDRVDKNLVATRPSGKPVVVKGFFSKDEEYDFIVEDIKKHLADGFSPEDICFIAAKKDELAQMGDRLTKEGIQIVFMNPEPLLGNSRVQAAIAYINALKDETDTKDILEYINAKMQGDLLSCDNTMLQIKVDELKASMSAWKSLPAEAKKAELLKELRSIDYRDDEIYQNFLSSLEFKESISELFEYVRDFEDFGQKQEYRRNHSYPGVALTTAHSSKGTEYPVIYNSLSHYDGERIGWMGNAEYQERLRLLFVSMTRARDELIITGEYDAWGKRGDYHYNRFLGHAVVASGRNDQDYYLSIEETRKERDEKIKAQKEAEKKAKKAAEKEKNVTESKKVQDANLSLSAT